MTRTGRPCDEHGDYLPEGTPPPPRVQPPSTDWFPYGSSNKFRTAEWVYKKSQISQPRINELLELWAETVDNPDKVPFENAEDLLRHIDETVVGDLNWQSFNMRYTGPKPATKVPKWMDGTYDVWFRDPHRIAQLMLANPDFDKEIDYAVLRQYEREAPNERRLQDFMSAEWACEQAVQISCS